jgi:hypothetical protein
MAHAAIVPTDDDRYYAGDAINIPFSFTDAHDGTVIDLTGMGVEFRLKENLTDADADALVEKTGTEGGTTNGVTFTDPVNGEVEININTGDTAAAVDDSSTGTRVESAIWDWHVRVIDTDGAQVTSETGTWEIWAS